MFKYICMRLLWALVVLVGILVTTFVILKSQPILPPTQEDQKRVFFHQQYVYGYMTRDFVDVSTDSEAKDYWMQQAIDHKGEIFWVWQSPQNENTMIVYQNVPIMIQFGAWVKNVITKFDWGTSNTLYVGRPVTEILYDAIQYSFKVNILVLIIEIPFGLALGIAAALKKDSVFDNISQIVIMIFISIPSFVLVSLLMKWLGSDLQWVKYKWPMPDSDLATRIGGYVIPVFSVVIGAIAGLARAVRAELSEGLTSEYVLLARTKGLTKRQAIFRHALRNSLLPIIPGLIFSFVGLLSGSAIIEMVYGIPGAGAMMLEALRNSDYNVIMLDTAFYGIVGLVAGVFMDITYGIIDPRIKMGAKNG